MPHGPALGHGGNAQPRPPITAGVHPLPRTTWPSLPARGPLPPTHHRSRSPSRQVGVLNWSRQALRRSAQGPDRPPTGAAAVIIQVDRPRQRPSAVSTHAGATRAAGPWLCRLRAYWCHCLPPHPAPPPNPHRPPLWTRRPRAPVAGTSRSCRRPPAASQMTAARPRAATRCRPGAPASPRALTCTTAPYARAVCAVFTRGSARTTAGTASPPSSTQSRWAT